MEILIPVLLLVGFVIGACAVVWALTADVSTKARVIVGVLGGIMSVGTVVAGVMGYMFLSALLRGI